MSVLLDLELEAASDADPGTPAYDRALRRLKVIECRTRQGVGFCSECRAYMDCTLIKQVLMDAAFGGSHGSSDGSRTT